LNLNIFDKAIIFMEYIIFINRLKEKNNDFDEGDV